MGVSDLPGCHRCGADPVFQWVREATDAEAAGQRGSIAAMHGRVLSDEEIGQRYGPLREAVTGCADHCLGAGAAGEDRRALLHGADCGGDGACMCTGTP